MSAGNWRIEDKVVPIYSGREVQLRNTYPEVIGRGLFPMSYYVEQQGFKDRYRTAYGDLEEFEDPSWRGTKSKEGYHLMEGRRRKKDWISNTLAQELKEGVIRPDAIFEDKKAEAMESLCDIPGSLLRTNGITTVRQLVSFAPRELTYWKVLGKASLKKVREFLNPLDLKLRDENDQCVGCGYLMPNVNEPRVIKNLCGSCTKIMLRAEGSYPLLQVMLDSALESGVFKSQVQVGAKTESQKKSKNQAARSRAQELLKDIDVLMPGQDLLGISSYFDAMRRGEVTAFGKVVLVNGVPVLETLDLD